MQCFERSSNVAQIHGWSQTLALNLDNTPENISISPRLTSQNKNNGYRVNAASHRGKVTLSFYNTVNNIHKIHPERRNPSVPARCSFT